MRKRGFALLALTALMTMGTAGITAMAAEGWAQENGRWAYYNAAGNRMYNVWRQGADGYWRYIDSNSYMATNKWVDNDDYYVDASGIMIANQWLQIAESSSETGYNWYYFTANGKAVRDGWEKINNQWYYFDDTGAMQTGWVLDDMYYCGSDGVMVTGWNKLTPPEEYADDDDYRSGPYEESGDGTYWYYFSSSGKKTVPNDDGDNIRQKRINGVYYCLRDDGAMMTGWTCVTGDDSDNIQDYRLVDENGKIRTGWYSAEPPQNLSGQYDHDVEWFYFNNKGIPTVGPDKGAANVRDLKRIDSNTYLFDSKGVPAYGLQKVYTDSEESDYTAYYFGSRKQSSMLKGKYYIDENGTTAQYYFTSTGRGYTGVYDNHLYYMGKLQKADSEDKYEVFTIWDGNNSKNYVVNSSGKIAKNTTVKNRDGVKYKTSSSGILLREDDEEVDGGTYTSPEEPEWESDWY